MQIMTNNNISFQFQIIFLRDYYFTEIECDCLYLHSVTEISDFSSPLATLSFGCLKKITFQC